ncbi:MAG: hypothetical protein EZS28_047870 [Streblomastix strix]|uniref:Uncharacterized protein n=1 Tax=Streblomastix strix TaxID=222440 RepID=A0A5J4TFT9_9EUKA|nr:MAG: hypothetical protein EZS28_047870 [Streblomastix strix]
MNMAVITIMMEKLIQKNYPLKIGFNAMQKIGVNLTDILSGQEKMKMFEILKENLKTNQVYMKDLNEWKDKTGDIRSGEYNTDANECTEVLLGLNNVDECA